MKQKREYKVEFWVNAQELEDINSEFKQARCHSRAEFVRRSVLGQKVIVNPSEVLHALDLNGVHLSRIGNNINQIARKVNTNSEHLRTGILDSFTREMARYHELLDQIVTSYRSLIRLLK